MKRTHIVLALAFVSCAAALSFANRNSGDEIVEAAPRVRSTGLPPGETKPSASAVSIAALRSRSELFGAATDDRHNLFDGSTIAPPLPSAAPALTEAPPLPPAAPSMPFTYIGKMAADGVWEIYLARGQETLIVREHTVIDSTYRVESIKPPILSLLYLPLKQVQTLDISGAN